MKNKKVKILLQMTSTTVGRNMSHQHSHGKMSQNFVAQSNIKLHNIRQMDVHSRQIGSHKLSFSVQSIYVYILCVYLSINKGDKFINFHPLLRWQRKKVWICIHHRGRIYFEIQPNEDAGHEEKRSESPS